MQIPSLEGGDGQYVAGEALVPPAAGKGSQARGGNRVVQGIRDPVEIDGGHSPPGQVGGLDPEQPPSLAQAHAAVVVMVGRNHAAPLIVGIRQTAEGTRFQLRVAGRPGMPQGGTMGGHAVVDAAQGEAGVSPLAMEPRQTPISVLLPAELHRRRLGGLQLPQCIPVSILHQQGIGQLDTAWTNWYQSPSRRSRSARHRPRHGSAPHPSRASRSAPEKR